jgi:hypothetical protein
LCATIELLLIESVAALSILVQITLALALRVCSDGSDKSCGYRFVSLRISRFGAGGFS